MFYNLLIFVKYIKKYNIMNKEKFFNLVSNDKSNWINNYKFRMENHYWLTISQKVSIKILRAIREQNISKELLSDKTDIPMEILQTMLKGKYNYSIEEIGRIEKALNINILN